MRTHKIVLSGAVLCLALSGVAMLSTGCAGDNHKRSTGAYIDDKGISTRVKTALFRDPNVSGFDVHVNTYRGEVQLSGFVDTQEQKEHAAAIAQNVEGVRAVVNNLELKPAPASGATAVGTPGGTVQGTSSAVVSPPPSPPGPAIGTSSSTPPVVTPAPTPLPAPSAPVVDNQPNANTSTFVPNNNPPPNNGPIPNQSASDRAMIDSAYQALPDRANLDITSNNGRLTVRGTAKSEEERLDIARQLLKVPGVVSVDNQIQVVPPPAK
jgi:osmotically-inducible protein OsmY